MKNLIHIKRYDISSGVEECDRRTKILEASLPGLSSMSYFHLDIFITFLQFQRCEA